MIDASGDEDWVQVRFLEAFLDQDDEELPALVDQIDEKQLILLMSTMLAAAVSEFWGASPSLDELADYARESPAHLEGDPSQIVVESVLRAGAGNRQILAGLDEDEILVATAIVTRRLVTDLSHRSVQRATLVDRAVRAAKDWSPPQ
jgi:hypothetical protein